MSKSLLPAESLIYPKASLILILLIYAYPSFSRDCDCEEEFLFIRDFIETNYAGFSDKVNAETINEYNEFTSEVLQNIRKYEDIGSCIYWIGEWLGYFKDQHIQFGGHFNLDDLNDEERKSLIKQRETINLAADMLANLEKSKGIEGIYWIQDSTYQIALIRSEPGFRDYAGIIMHSSNPNWFPGQVKLELRHAEPGLLNGVLYFSNHQPNYVSYAIHADNLGDSWYRDGVQRKPATEFVPVDSRIISDSTLYIKIGTFMEWNAANVDSVFNYNEPLLSSMPNLILDLRDNGGGSDFTYASVLPWIDSGPIEIIGSEVLSTSANIDSWKPLLDNPFLSEEIKLLVDSLLQEMEQNPGTFVSLIEDKIIEPDSVSPYPRKVAILINRRCASSCESFTLRAIQSDKVILMGENTAGILDYANMREQKFKCYPYTLNYSTTRSRMIDIGKGIDNIGIPPEIHLTEDQNWVEEALKRLEQKSQ